MKIFAHTDIVKAANMAEKTNKPLIGIICRTQHLEEEYYYVEKRYIMPVLEMGGIPLIVPPDEAAQQHVNYIDGIIFPGGVDIYPKYYDEKLKKSTDYDKHDDYLELKILSECVQRELPILGICKGAQIINIFFGGTLKEIHGKTELKHNNHGDFVSHKIFIKPNSILDEILKVNSLKVLSAHSQAIDELGTDVIITAKASDDIIEAIEIKNNDMILGVQFHPEMSVEKTDQDNLALRNIFTWLINKSKNKNGKRGSKMNLLRKLANLANELDLKGHFAEADGVDSILKIASDKHSDNIKAMEKALDDLKHDFFYHLHQEDQAKKNSDHVAAKKHKEKVQALHRQIKAGEEHLAKEKHRDPTFEELEDNAIDHNLEHGKGATRQTYINEIEHDHSSSPSFNAEDMEAFDKFGDPELEMEAYDNLSMHQLMHKKKEFMQKLEEAQKNMDMKKIRFYRTKMQSLDKAYGGHVPAAKDNEDTRDTLNKHMDALMKKDPYRDSF